MKKEGGLCSHKLYLLYLPRVTLGEVVVGMEMKMEEEGMCNLSMLSLPMVEIYKGRGGMKKEGGLCRL